MMLICFLLNISVLKFSVDPVVFQTSVEIRDTINEISLSTQRVYYLEFNCEIPYQELHYSEAGDTIISQTEIRLCLVDSIRKDSLLDTLKRNFTISSFRSAAKDEQVFIVQFGLFINAGDYRYDIEIISGDRRGFTSGGLQLEKGDYEMSGLLLASSITKDTIGGFLCKGNLMVVPRPSHLFKESDRNIFLYYELYNRETGAAEKAATYSVTDSSGRLVRKFTQRISDTRMIVPVNVGMNIQNLQSGPYRFRVAIFDSARAESLNKDVSFQVVRRDSHKVSFEGLPYYEEIEYFVSGQEYKTFKSLDATGKANFLKKFWDAHNYYEIAERYDYAEEHFGQGDKPGYKTDRGRIHIKFGAPDEIEESTIELEVSKPYRQWNYYNGLIFIFVDIRSTNEYVLVWTNARGERSQPTLFNYLPESKREELDKF